MTEDAETAAGLEAAHPWGTLGTADDIADAALFLAGDEAYDIPTFVASWRTLC